MRSSTDGPRGNAILLPKISSIGFHARLLILLGLLLSMAVFFVVSSNIREEEERMQIYMKNRADVLIWALEGSTRSMRGGGAMQHMQSMQQGTDVDGANERRHMIYQLLLQEVAMQPGVDYLAICSTSGLILAHSNPELVGSSLYTAEEMKPWLGIEESQARFVTRDGQKVFEVVKEFTPRRPPMGWHGPWGHGSPKSMYGKDIPGSSHNGEDVYREPSLYGGPYGGSHGGGHGGGMRHYPDGAAPFGPELGMAEAAGLQNSPESGVLVFVGIDPVPYETWLADSARSSVILGMAIVLLCIGPVFLFLLVQKFRASKRHYYNARSLTLQLFESLPMGLLATGVDGAVLINNQQASDLLGISAERKGLPRRELKLADYPGVDWKGLIQELEKGHTIVDRELELKRAGENAADKGVPISLSASAFKDYSGKLAGYLFMLRDLKEVNQLKEQVRLGERLSALGNLAAGVAHEIRNPLSSIKGYIAFLNDKFAGNAAADSSVREAAQMMNDEVERLNKVVSELLGVAKAGELKLENISLLEVVKRALRLIEAEAAGKKVSLKFESVLVESETTSRLDKDKLLQALLNILINAVQASPEGGEVLISLEKGEEDELRLGIKDSGAGMSYEVQSKIFIPYFTTKPEGTGLGLTITHQIVEQHQGRLEVASLPGKGTRFTLVLPFTGK